MSEDQAPNPGMNAEMFISLTSAKEQLLRTVHDTKVADWLDEEEQIAYIMDIVEMLNVPFKNLQRLWVTRYVKERMQK